MIKLPSNLWSLSTIHRLAPVKCRNVNQEHISGWSYFKESPDDPWLWLDIAGVIYYVCLLQAFGSFRPNSNLATWLPWGYMPKAITAKTKWTRCVHNCAMYTYADEPCKIKSHRNVMVLQSALGCYLHSNTLSSKLIETTSTNHDLVDPWDSSTLTQRHL